MTALKMDKGKISGKTLIILFLLAVVIVIIITPRELIENAKSFVMDSHARNKARYFMWKLRQLRMERAEGG